jgi:hypothetical protein
MKESTFAELLASQRGDEAWDEIALACDCVPVTSLTPTVIRDWLPRVARYSFHPVEV